MREAFLEEERKMRRLRLLVDFTRAVLLQADLSLSESLDWMVRTRKAAIQLFPGKESVYDLIYTPRFLRIIHTRFHTPVGPLTLPL
jgi:hypothetical protein